MRLFLASILMLGALALTSCGDNHRVDPDARPIPDAALDDSGVALRCDPTTSTDIVLQEVVRGLADPLLVVAPKGDPRLFVVEQPGSIRIVLDNTLLPGDFLNIEDLVLDTGNEQGLLGLAFHPNYAENGRFYVNYTGSPSGVTTVAEYTVSDDANVANPEAKILLTIDQPRTNHNGGMLAFAQDGYLHISTGDGGKQKDPDGNGQSLNTHLGKILRIDVDSGDPYGIPADNPFADGVSGLPEIWAYGLRNPWRFSFDEVAGDVYISDVGQLEWEEINVQSASTAGVNYGWNTLEGPECFEADACDTSNKVAPVHAYPHTENRQAVTGGYVYRGTCLPGIEGWYFFGDYAGGQIYKFENQDGMATNLVDLTSEIDPNGDVEGLTSFGEDGFGELYVVSRGGKIFQIIAKPPT